MVKMENLNMKGWMIGLITTICLGLGAWALAGTSENKVSIGKLEAKQESYDADAKELKRDVREIKNFIMEGNVSIVHNKNKNKDKVNLTER